MAENLDPTLTYLQWSAKSFPSSSSSQLKVPAGSTIDWGDGTVDTFDTETSVPAHTYEDYDSGTTEHLITISGLTEINNSAFRGCSGLISIEISNNVANIGPRAFDGCESLTSVEIPDSVTSIGQYAFEGCWRLTSVIIPDSVIPIGMWAFSYCYGLTSVVIGNGVTSIGQGAFYACYKLVEVVNKSTHITVEKGSDFNGYVGYHALAVYNSGDAYESKLSYDNEYIIYTDGEEKILVGYTGTETDLVFPSYATKIYKYAFYTCNSLTSIVIPDSVTSIGYDAFYNCRSLTSVTIGNSVTSVDPEAFGLCYNLNIFYTGDETEFCQKLGAAFYGASDWNLYIKNRLATELFLPDGYTQINNDFLSGCQSVKRLVIPESATYVAVGGLTGCPNVKELVICTPNLSFDMDAGPNPASIDRVYVPLGSKKHYSSRFGDDKVIENNTYLSLVKYNRANKKYIDSAIASIEPSSTVDDAMSSTSTNPVQNKVVTAALNSKADASAIPTKTSQLTNDSGYLTEHQSLDGLATETWVNNNAKPTVTQTLTSGTEIGLVTVGTTTTKLYAPTIEEDSVLTNEMVNAMF